MSEFSSLAPLPTEPTFRIPSSATVQYVEGNFTRFVFFYQYFAFTLLHIRIHESEYQKNLVDDLDRNVPSNYTTASCFLQHHREHESVRRWWGGPFYEGKSRKIIRRNARRNKAGSGKMNQQLGKSKNIDNLLRVSVAECSDTEWRVERKAWSGGKNNTGIPVLWFIEDEGAFSRSFLELNNRKDVKIASS